MDRLLIEVVCAVTSKSYEFWVPKKMLVSTLVQMLVEDIMLYEQNDQLYDVNGRVFLYLYEKRTFLNMSHTAQEAGISSGCRLMLV